MSTQLQPTNLGLTKRMGKLSVDDYVSIPPDGGGKVGVQGNI